MNFAEDIKSYSLPELEKQIKDMNLPSFRAKQIYRWLHKNGAENFDEMTNLSSDLRNKLKESFTIRNCRIERKQTSSDGTVKYLFRLFDDEFIESVLMKYKYGYSLCVSSQVGCRMGCAFCASTLSGRVRSLSPSEILSQIHAAQRDMNVRVSHVVMMGMGEPLDNFDNSIRFLELVTDEDGLNIGMRNISLSTCGIIPKIDELAQKKLQLTLSISLHAPNDKLRSELMPVNKSYPVDELLNACRRYTDITSRRISFEYIGINGINDTDDCAMELSRKLKGMLCHVNIIPANEFGESGYKKSSSSQIECFVNILEKNGINVTVRRSLGSDIDASCGQLRMRHKKEL